MLTSRGPAATPALFAEESTQLWTWAGQETMHFWGIKGRPHLVRGKVTTCEILPNPHWTCVDCQALYKAEGSKADEERVVDSPHLRRRSREKQVLKEFLGLSCPHWWQSRPSAALKFQGRSATDRAGPFCYPSKGPEPASLQPPSSSSPSLHWMRKGTGEWQPRGGTRCQRKGTGGGVGGYGGGSETRAAVGSD